MEAGQELTQPPLLMNPLSHAAHVTDELQAKQFKYVDTTVAE